MVFVNKTVSVTVSSVVENNINESIAPQRSKRATDVIRLAAMGKSMQEFKQNKQKESRPKQKNHSIKGRSIQLIVGLES